MIDRDTIVKNFTKKINKYKSEGNYRYAKILEVGLRKLVDNNDYSHIELIQALDRIPVTIEEFVSDPYYLGNGDLTLWPSMIRDLKIICPDVYVGEKKPSEVVFTGSTGIGKTLRANIALCYDLYQLTCFKDPQKYFGLSKIKPIMVACSSARPMTVKKNVLRPVIGMFSNMLYTKENVKINKDKLKTELEIESHNISFIQLPADREAYLGHDLIAASVEEVNAMKRISRSSRGEGGEYDQAQELMSEIIARRKGRFQHSPIQIGSVYTVSSANHFDDYISRKIQGLSVLNEEELKDILVLDQTRWDVVPENRYPSKEHFWWLLTTREYQGRILSNEEYFAKDYPSGGAVIKVPEEHRVEALLDPDTFQRDVIGKPAMTVEMFLRNPDKLHEAIRRWKSTGSEIYVKSSIHGRNMLNYDLRLDGLPCLDYSKLPIDKHLPRIVHIDIATGSKNGVSDRCAISVVKYRGNEAKEILSGYVENSPNYQVELAISIQPSGGKEVMIEQIRDFALSLADAGLNIILFSFDQHQSKESQQKIANAGFRVNQFSCRKEPESYTYFKECLYSNRLDLPPNDLMVEEAEHLQQDANTGKVQAAAGMHDDIMDSIVSALYQFSIMPGIVPRSLSSSNGDPTAMRRSVHRRSINRRNINRR